MAAKGLGISVSDAGIGATLNQRLLMVPANQRSYAWEEAHVQTLFEDFSVAINNGDESYFLGTLVLTQGSDDRLEVADGQQRLATTSILIAAIRDYLEQMGDGERLAAHKYTSEYLLIYDEMSGEHTPKLQLNYEDNDFFLNNILITPTQRLSANIVTNVSSHERLFAASALAKKHVEKIVAQFARPDRAKALFNWVKFLREAAMVIEIRVPDHINAFTMFETLNDRGLRASQTDILKNFLFGKAQDRLREIQIKWSSMVATIETIGDEDLLLTYLRHHWTLSNGYTSERELARLVKERVTGRQQALTMATSLDEFASDYVGLMNPLEYSGWGNTEKITRAYIYIITNVLSVEQIRPLLISVLKKFDQSEAKAAMKMLLSWSVRFLIAGSGGGGAPDRAYGQLAKDVMDGSITAAKQLKEQVRAGILRTDAEFIQAFSKARVSKTNLVRYYLRALELYSHQESNPELGGTLDDNVSYNVEHVLPLSESEGWDILEQTAQQYRKRLGNMALLNPTTNMKLGNKAFSEKRVVFAASPLLLTQKVGEFLEWGPEQVDARQQALAELAVKVWPS